MKGELKLNEKSELVKLNINLIRCEKDNLSEMMIEYEKEIAKTILKLKPTNETEYKLATLQAEIEHSELKNEIIQKENEIDSLEMLLEHKDEMAEAYFQFREDNKELLDLLEKLFGE